MKQVDAHNCGQENTLVAFLYGELSDVEARTFQRHLSDCAECHAELAGFKEVRNSVVAWRNESLGSLAMVAGHVSPVSPSTDRKPSALAALRELFNLTPLWMKGAVAFASVLFLLIAGLAIIRLRDKPAPLVATQGNKTYSQEQLNTIVTERVQQQLELERARRSTEPPPNSRAVVKNIPERNPAPRVSRRDSEVAASNPIQKSRRPLSKTEREQLAADLRLTSAKNDSEFDLLGDRINQ